MSGRLTVNRESRLKLTPFKILMLLPVPKQCYMNVTAFANTPSLRSQNALNYDVSYSRTDGLVRMMFFLCRPPTAVRCRLTVSHTCNGVRERRSTIYLPSATLDKSGASCKQLETSHVGGGHQLSSIPFPLPLPFLFSPLSHLFPHLPVSFPLSSPFFSPPLPLEVGSRYCD